MLSVVLRCRSGEGPPDRELLARFVSTRDEESFSELVRRHGAMVLAVCRRVTGHAQDAEEAFQAAFLVLARRASHIDRPELLGNWLYGVAYRTALDARAARRRVKEHPMSDAPEPTAPPPQDDHGDLRAVIDEELARLPEKYRSAVVLCDLEGLSRKDAAARLCVPEGTLSSRLAHARKVLAGRLSRRGITASAGAIASVLGGETLGTAVPLGLAQQTARAAALFAAGGTSLPGVIGDRVVTLTDGVIKAMVVNRLRLVVGSGILALGMVGLGTAIVTGQDNAPRPMGRDPFAPPPLPSRPPQSAAPGKGKPAEKIPAKGIEDEDVPYSSVPKQAVIRWEDGKLIVRQRHHKMISVTADQAGRKVTSYQPSSSVVGYKYDATDVAVFDMKGNRIQTKAWKEKLKDDTHVLLAFDGRLPHPRELALFKDDALLVVFPTGISDADSNLTSTSGGLYRPRVGPDGTTYYEPVQNSPTAPVMESLRPDHPLTPPPSTDTPGPVVPANPRSTPAPDGAAPSIPASNTPASATPPSGPEIPLPLPSPSIPASNTPGMPLPNPASGAPDTPPAPTPTPAPDRANRR